MLRKLEQYEKTPPYPVENAHNKLPYPEYSNVSGPPPSGQPMNVVISQPGIGINPQQIFCPTCKKTITSETMTKPGSWTYIMCLILCCVGCDLGCCLIPFCVDSCKDVNHTCPECERIVATKEYKPFS
nr:hypothetical transcript [Hymenolepis microstoma]